MFVTLLLVSLEVSGPVYGAVFSFYSSCDSGIILVNQTVEYKCTLSDVDPADIVAITAWKINHVSSTSNSWETLVSNYNISIEGTSTHSSKLRIHGNLTLNASTIECVAAGIVGQKGYSNTSGLIRLNVQEKLSKVDDLEVKLHKSSVPGIIEITWKAPSTKLCVTISGYKVYITNTKKNLVILHQTIEHNSTSLMYNVSGPGSYNVSVISIAKDNLTSDANFKTVNISTVSYHRSVDLVSFDNGIWKNKLAVKLSSEMFSTPLNFTVVLGRNNGNDNEKDIEREFEQISANETIPTNIEFSTKENRSTNASLQIKFENGFITPLDTIHLDFFRVEDIKISNASDGKTCFKCLFIKGSYNQGCSVFYECTETGMNGSIVISKLQQEECVKIPPSEYDVTVYDFDLKNKIETNIKPAFVFSITVAHSLSVSSSRNIKTTMSANTDITAQPTFSNNDNLISTTTILVLFSSNLLILILSAVIMSLCIFILKKKKKSRCSLESTTELHVKQITPLTS